MRAGFPRTRAFPVRILPRKVPRRRARQIRQSPGRGNSIWRARSREPPPHGAREEHEAQARATRGGPLCDLWRTKTRRRRRRLRDVPGSEASGREGTLRQAQSLRAMRQMRGGSYRQGFDVLLVRRKGHKTPSAQERREPGTVSCKARTVALRGLLRAGKRSRQVRALREAIISLLRRAQGNARPSAALHGGRTHHGGRARPSRLLGGGGDVPRLRESLPG